MIKRHKFYIVIFRVAIFVSIMLEDLVLPLRESAKETNDSMIPFCFFVNFFEVMDQFHHNK